MNGQKVARFAMLAGVAMVGACGIGMPVAATPKVAVAPGGSDMAALFGARESVIGVKLSPDGRHVVYLSADTAAGTRAMVAASDGSSPPTVALVSSGNPDQLLWCDWADDARLVCSINFIQSDGQNKLGFQRLIAVDTDGKNLKMLSQPRTGAAMMRMSQYDGDVIDWMGGTTGKVLLERDHVPEEEIGTRLAHTANGLGVDLVDTRSLAASQVEIPSREASSFISDGRGVIRMMEIDNSTGVGVLTGTAAYSYRTRGSRQWRTFSSVAQNGAGLRPLSVDPVADVAYCLDRITGRDQLYRVSLDGSMKTELVYADPHVDVDDVVRLGRQAKLIGVTTVAEKRQIIYFDKDYADLAAALGKALPGHQIDIVSSSADEQTLLLYAGADNDSGRYLVFDRKTHHLNEIALVRPQLEHVVLATQQAITYRAADGTEIPAYLTLPPGGPKKGLPAIVMPHGGPNARDEWGFDWLSQFFAAQGYAVLQPNYRGSAGYGEAWLMKQGFQSWDVAIGDVADAGRWLVASGIAAPDHLAIVGWSYGGYAALQSNVVDPDLFKAVIAIAPVTDFDTLREEKLNFTDYAITNQEIGSGPHVAAGSPARHPDRFKAPVMLFHGTMDLNVNVRESWLMNDRLHAAGKQSTLVVYDGLDHQLPSGEIRADMLRRADGFLRRSMHIGG